VAGVVELAIMGGPARLNHLYLVLLHSISTKQYHETKNVQYFAYFATFEQLLCSSKDKIKLCSRAASKPCSYMADRGTPIATLNLKTHHCSTRNADASLAFFHFRKGIKMNANQKGSSSGGSKQGGNQGGSQGSNKQSGGKGSSGGSGSSGTQGGTHEQHVEAGRQSHKNDGNKQSK
jgi:uncharacterized membrane protein YgcG